MAVNQRKLRAVIFIFLVLTAFCVLAGCGVKEPDVSVPSAGTETPASEKAEVPTTTPAPTSGEEAAAPSPTKEPEAAVDYSGGSVKDKPLSVAMYPSGGTKEPFCGTGHSIAVQFYATADFSGVGFESPTWTAKDGYSLDYTLYKRDRDFPHTVAGRPVAGGSFENWADGANVPLKVDSLPAGEYVLTAEYYSSENMKNSGVWYMDSECECQRSYLDDEVWYDVSVCMNIKYLKTPANKYGPLSPSGID